MKKRTYGVWSALLYPLLIVMFSIMEYTRSKSIGSTLIAFLIFVIVGLYWYGGHNNLITILSDKIVVRNCYMPWKKAKIIEFQKIRRVKVDEGTRYGPTLFTCVLENDNLIKLYSSMITAPEIKKIITEFEQHGIIVETDRM